MTFLASEICLTFLTVFLSMYFCMIFWNTLLNLIILFYWVMTIPSSSSLKIVLNSFYSALLYFISKNTSLCTLFWMYKNTLNTTRAATIVASKLPPDAKILIFLSLFMPREKMSPLMRARSMNSSNRIELSNRLFTSYRFIIVYRAWKRVIKFQVSPIIVYLFSISYKGITFLIVKMIMPTPIALMCP